MPVKPVPEGYHTATPYLIVSGTLVDPFGHTWSIATHIEDVPPEEMKRRSEEAMKKNE